MEMLYGMLEPITTTLAIPVSGAYAICNTKVSISAKCSELSPMVKAFPNPPQGLFSTLKSSYTDLQKCF